MNGDGVGMHSARRRTSGREASQPLLADRLSHQFRLATSLQRLHHSAWCAAIRFSWAFSHSSSQRRLALSETGLSQARVIVGYQGWQPNPTRCWASTYDEWTQPLTGELILNQRLE